MYTIAMFKEFYRHMHWADAEIWNTVLAHSGAKADKQLKSTLHHTHLTQLAFVHIWNAAPMEFPEEAAFADLPALCAWAKATAQKQDAYLRNLAYDALDQPAKIPWLGAFEEQIGQKPVPSSLAETLLQVPMHSQHHRGQICSRLRVLGAEPPLVDYIAWCWRGKPLAEWPQVG